VPRATPALKGTRWVKCVDLPGEALPNVMRKVLAHAQAHDPEKWEPVFGKDHAQMKKLQDSRKRGTP
jgi:hypothetical protein